MTSPETENTTRAMRGPMKAIQIQPVTNGWIIRNDPPGNSYVEPSTAKIARTTKELCGLVETWANDEGKPSDKREAAKK